VIKGISTGKVKLSHAGFAEIQQDRARRARRAVVRTPTCQR